jgi:hypothetical protein
MPPACQPQLAFSPYLRSKPSYLISTRTPTEGPFFPQKILQLAGELCGAEASKNGGSKFVPRYKACLDSKYCMVQDAARLKVDTEETRRAFYALVSGCLRASLNIGARAYQQRPLSSTEHLEHGRGQL